MHPEKPYIRIVVAFFVLLIIVVIAAGIYRFDITGGDMHVSQPGSLDPKNATYQIDGKSVTLSSGTSVQDLAPGSASKITTKYFGNEATGDLNGDGKDDEAFIITQDMGGSGTFYYLAAEISGPNGYSGTNAVFLGDRIAPQPTSIMSGIITANYADRKPGEPMTASPSMGVSRHFHVENGMLTEIAK